MKKIIYAAFISFALTSCQNATNSQNNSNSDTLANRDSLKRELLGNGDQSKFDDGVALAARHPEIIGNPTFQNWSQKYETGKWHETQQDKKGNITVIVQSIDGINLIAFLIKSANNAISNITDIRQFDLQKNMNTKANAISLLEQKDSSLQEIAVRPVVDWSKKGSALRWEVEAIKANHLELYLADSVQIVPIEKRNFDAQLNYAQPPATVADDLQENELHHLAKYKALADQICLGATTPAEKARKIYTYVRTKMKYDATIVDIGPFTWSDVLVIDQLNYKGICDEWAVVEITLLRAVGVPAVIKFLSFHYNGKDAAHACLEWSDNGNWKHMDALWNAFDNKAIYRQNGCTDVKVMDASQPIDSRYSGLAWGVPDPNGDLKLNPYKDFILNPGYPGNTRSGYSN